MSKRNQGHKLEIITIIINLFCYAYDIFIDYLGEYNKYPVYLPDGNENEPNKKREIKVNYFGIVPCACILFLRIHFSPWFPPRGFF